MKKKSPLPPPLPFPYTPCLHRGWLLYLLLSEPANDRVRGILASDNLPCPEDVELAAMRAEHPPPRGFKPHDEKHVPSIAFLQKVGVESLFRKSPDAEHAVAILRRPASRQFVEALLIVGVPTAAIAKALKGYVHHEVSPKAVEIFRKFMFNVRAVGRSELTLLVQARVRLALERASSGADDKAVRRAIKDDARTRACFLAATRLSCQAILLKLGFPPGRINLAETLDQLESVAAIRTGEAMLSGDSNDAREATAFAGILRQVRDIKETVAIPDLELRKQLQGFALRTNETPVVTMNELLAKGEGVTADIMPLGELHADLGGDVVDEPGSPR